MAENTIPIMLVTIPLVAIPFGNVFLCLIERIKPTIPETMPNIIQHNTMLKIPKIKLVIPNVLLFC